MTVLLAIETASDTCSVAIAELGKREFLSHQEMASGQSEKLMPMIATIIQAWGEKIFLPDRILVSCGPGSFTGLRIGIATAKGLGLAYKCPVIGLSTMTILCAGLRQNPDSHQKPLLQVMTTKRSDFYTAHYDQQGCAVGETLALEAEGLRQYVTQHFDGAPFWLVGNAAIAVETALNLSSLGAEIPSWNSIPTAAFCVEAYKLLDQRGTDFAHRDFLPRANYIRPADSRQAKRIDRQIFHQDIQRLLS